MPNSPLLHPIIFEASGALNGLAQVAYIADGVISGDGASTLGLKVPAYARYLVDAYANSAHLNRAQLRAGSLKSYFAQQFGSDVAKLRVSGLPLTGTPEPWLPDPQFGSGFPLSPDESLTAFADNLNNAEQSNIVGWLSDKPYGPYGSAAYRETRPIVWVKATGTTTVNAGAWTPAPLTLEDVNPGGSFDIVDFRAQGATMLAWRFLPIWSAQGAQPTPNPNNLRVGWLASGAAASLRGMITQWSSPTPFQCGRGGVLSSLASISQPVVPEVFCISADTAQSYWIGLCRRNT